MSSAIVKLLRNPSKYLPIARKAALQPLCRVFQNSSFFLQGQMDIHPLSRWRSSLTAKTGGFYPSAGGVERRILNLEPHDNTRRDMLTLFLRTIVEKQIQGAFAELGVYKGLTARLIHHYAPERPLHLFDTFAGFTAQGAQRESQVTGLEISASQFADTSLEGVRQFVSPKNGNVHFHAGYFPQSLPDELRSEAFAFVHLDADLYEPIFQGLQFFYSRLTPGGMIVVHDYNTWPGARQAVDEFFADKPELPVPMPDKSGSVLIVKQLSAR